MQRLMNWRFYLGKKKKKKKEAQLTMMGKMISRAVGITVTANMAGHTKLNWKSMARFYIIAIYIYI